MGPLVWVVLLNVLVAQSLAARILLVLPLPGRSHHMFATAIMKALARRGHQLVEYSPYRPAEAFTNHSHVEVHTRIELESDTRGFERTREFIDQYESSMFGHKQRGIWDFNYVVCEDTLNHENIQKLWKSNERFDLVMTESTFGEESLLVFGHRFSAPTITLEGYVPFSLLNWDAGNVLSIASVPDLTATTFANRLMSIRDRTLNAISVVMTLASYHLVHIPRHDDIIRRANYSGSPLVSQMVDNVALYFTNSNPTSVNYVQPYTANIVPIGGIHISPDHPYLSQDIQKFMDDAPEGVIYVSFGTLIQAHRMSKEFLQIFVNVFRRLPHKVLWSIALDALPGLPNNVRLTKFAPQTAVLEHKNCKLFITHGGLFSHHEAIHAGVPTVGVPFLADQPYNVQFSEHSGIGVTLDWRTLSEHTLYTAITTVLQTSRYKDNALRLSRIYRDRPMSPADSAVFWVEYVLRHKGAPHLKPSLARLVWYQRVLLDVLTALLAAAIISIAVVFVVIRKLLPLVGENSGKKQVRKRKKKNK